LVFSHQINFGQRGILKYLIFDNLFVLVRFVIFNCFTLHCFELHFLPILFLLFANKSKFYFNCNLVQNFTFHCRSVQFQFSKQSNSVLISEVRILINCISVPNFPKLHFSPFLQFCPRDATQAGKSTCHKLIGSGTHMAAYKRPPLYKSESESTVHAPHQHKQNSFSLSWQLRIKIHKFTEKLMNIHKP